MTDRSRSRYLSNNYLSERKTMDSLITIFTFTRMFFIFNLFSHFSAEDINGNPEWKLAFQKIEELQKTQDERISLLEKRPLESEVTELKNTVKNQGDEIAQLKARIREFETIFSTSYKDKPEEDVPLSEANEEISVSFNKPFVRKGTLIAISISFNESFTLRK